MVLSRVCSSKTQSPLTKPLARIIKAVEKTWGRKGRMWGLVQRESPWKQLSSIIKPIRVMGAATKRIYTVLSAHVEDKWNILRLFTRAAIQHGHDGSHWYCTTRRENSKSSRLPFCGSRKPQKKSPVLLIQLLLPGFCIFWHIYRSLSRPGLCWIRFCISAECKKQIF